MKGIDYAKGMSEKRTEFKKNLEELRQNYNTDLQRMDRKNQYSQDLKDRAHLESKYRMEQDVQANQERVKANTIDLIQKNKGQFQERLNSVKDDFYNERNKNRVDFDSKLHSLNDSYNRAFEREHKDQGVIHDSIRKNYLERLGENVKKQEKQVHDVSEQSKNKDIQNRQEFAEFRKTMAENHQVEKEDLRKLETEKRLNAVNQRDKVVVDQGLIHEQTKENIRNNYDKILSDREKISKNMLSTQNEAFSKNMHHLMEQNERDLSKEKNSNSMRLQEIEKDNFKEKEKLNRRLVLEGINGDSASVGKTQEGIRSKNLSDQMKKNQETLNQSKFEVERKADEARVEYLTNLKNQKLLHATEKSKLMKEKSDDLAFVQSENASINNKTNSEFQAQTRDLQNAMDARNSFNIKKLEDKVNRQQARYVEQMDDILYKNDQEIKSILDKMRSDRKKIYLQTQEEKNEIRSEMQEQFRAKNEQVTLAGEGKVNEISDLLEKNQRQSKFVVEKLKNKNVENVNHQNYLLEEIQKENRTSTDDLVEKKDKMYAEKIVEMKKNYERWINEIRNKGDEKIKELVSKYENMLLKKESEFIHKTKRLENTFKREHERLNQDFMIKEGNIKVQYEDKLNLQKENYEERIDNLKKRTI